MSVGIQLVIGEQDCSQDPQKIKASKIMGLPLQNFDYVRGQTWDADGNVVKVGKCHISGWGQQKGTDVFKTLCGIDDTPGNWPFAVDDCFDGDDGCKNCRRVLNKVRRKP